MKSAPVTPLKSQAFFIYSRKQSNQIAPTKDINIFNTKNSTIRSKAAVSSLFAFLLPCPLPWHPLTSFQLPALFSRRPRHPVQTIADCSTTLYAIWKIHLNCQYIPSIIETTIVLISVIIKLAMFGIRYTIKNNTINPAIIFNWMPTENIFI